MRKTKKVPATLCGHPIHVCKKGKIHPLCKKCMARYPLEITHCSMCDSELVFSAITQYIYAKKGLNLPTRCSQCNKDTKLFMRAICVVQRHCRASVSPVFKKVSLLGFRTGELVAVLRDRLHNELVAEVCIETQPRGERIPHIRYVDR